MGHENVGEVVAVGPDAKGVKIGDRRLVYPWMGCGECAVCKRGDENLCAKPRNVGVFRPAATPTTSSCRIRAICSTLATLPPEKAAPLACSGVTAYSALKKVERDHQGPAGRHYRRRAASG